MSHRTFEHTADVGIEAAGPDAETALAEAAHGLAEVIAGVTVHDHPREGLVERVFYVEAPDRESLLVAWLSELVWRFESEGLLWAGGGVRLSETEDGLRIDVAGNMAPYDPARHGTGVEVKAVTYHDVFLGPDGDGWRARVILDI